MWPSSQGPRQSLLLQLNFLGWLYLLHRLTGESGEKQHSVLKEDGWWQRPSGNTRLPSQSLPLKYLGVPISGKSLSSNNCAVLIAELQAIIVRWSKRCFSYMGRVQLVDWVFHEKFKYLTQNSFFPKHTIQKVQSIAYQFIWRVWGRWPG